MISLYNRESEVLMRYELSPEEASEGQNIPPFMRYVQSDRREPDVF